MNRKQSLTDKQKNIKTRGFVTIATGSEVYYKIAVNLLNSYRLATKDPMPFAIMSDQKNKCTDLFDDVIIIDNPQRTFMDKFVLLKAAPYQETIFFDADILAYGDLNYYWGFFKTQLIFWLYALT